MTSDAPTTILTTFTAAMARKPLNVSPAPRRHAIPTTSIMIAGITSAMIAMYSTASGAASGLSCVSATNWVLKQATPAVTSSASTAPATNA